MTGSEHAAVRVVCVGTTSTRAATVVDRLDDRADGIEAVAAGDTGDALDHLDAGAVDCVAVVHDPPELDAVEFLADIREDHPYVPVVVCLADGPVVQEALRAGAADVIRAPVDAVDTGLFAHRIDSAVSNARARADYREIFDRANDGIAVHDPETAEVIEANRRLYEILGYDPGTHDLSLSDLASGSDPYTVAEARERVLAAADGEPQTFEWLDETKDGDRVWVEVDLERTRLGTRERVLAFVRDVT